MILDLNSDELPLVIEADVCIIGAGAAGIVLAKDLAARHLQIVLLESGGREYEAAIKDLHRGVSVGLTHRGIDEGRFHALGGSTTKWIGQMIPLEPIDFEKRPWIDWSGWPLDYAELAPYYERAFEPAGLDGCLSTDAEVWERAGLDPPDLGNGLDAYCSRWCPETNFAKLHFRTLEHSETIKCLLHATVTAFSASDKFVNHVVVRNGEGKSLEARARVFILCAGAIETPRLLLQPLQDGQRAPWAELDAIGRYFQDHLFGSIGDIVPRNSNRLHDIFDKIYLNGFKYHPRFNLSEAKQRQFRLLGAGGLVTFETSKLDLVNQTREACREIWRGRLDASIVARLASGVVQGGTTMAQLLWRGLVRGRAYNPDDLGVCLTVQLEQAPRPESRVYLSDEMDALNIRRVKLDWRLGQSEVDTIASFAKIVASAFQAIDLAEVKIYPDVAARSLDALDRLQDFYHHSGTARMAESSAKGVVDSNLQVFGANNLYVCGGAVFPTNGVANPVHTIIALAVRLADHIGIRLARA